MGRALVQPSVAGGPVSPGEEGPNRLMARRRRSSVAGTHRAGRASSSLQLCMPSVEVCSLTRSECLRQHRPTCEGCRQRAARRSRQMQIQVNTDDNVRGNDELTRHVEAEIGAALSRFSDQLTRVEGQLNDQNASKFGGADKRCKLEARTAGKQPGALPHQAGTLGEAC